MFKNAYKEGKLKEIQAHADKTKNLNFINSANVNNPHPFQSAPIRLAQPLNMLNQISINTFVFELNS